ncbi:hypothetical protein HK405_012122, partial [Cladochytrium tenue]
VVCLEKFGYGSDDVYERIREEIKRSSLFRFDWFIKSRTAVELSRRCSTLVALLQKEEAEELEQQQEVRKRKAVATEPATAPGSRSHKKKKKT